MIKFLILMLAGLSFNCLAQTKPSLVKFISPTLAGYSQSIEVDLGNAKMVIISGQVPLDKRGNVIGNNDLAKQLEQNFQNIKAIVEEAGGTMSDVVKLNYYLKDISQIQLVRAVRNRYINTQKPPASTTVEVNRLLREDILVEIEATAIISKKE